MIFVYQEIRSGIDYFCLYDFNLIVRDLRNIFELYCLGRKGGKEYFVFILFLFLYEEYIYFFFREDDLKFFLVSVFSFKFKIFEECVVFFYM